MRIYSLTNSGNKASAHNASGLDSSGGVAAESTHPDQVVQGSGVVRRGRHRWGGDHRSENGERQSYNTADDQPATFGLPVAATQPTMQQAKPRSVCQGQEPESESPILTPQACPEKSFQSRERLYAKAIAYAKADGREFKLGEFRSNAGPRFVRTALLAYYILHDMMRAERAQLLLDGASIDERWAAARIHREIEDGIAAAKAWLSRIARRGGRGQLPPLQRTETGQQAAQPLLTGAVAHGATP